MSNEITIRNVKIKEAAPGYFLTIGETFVKGRRADDSEAQTRVENTWSVTEEELLDLKVAIEEILAKKERRKTI